MLGGDFNVRSLSLEGYEHVAGHHVDHVYVHGLAGDRRRPRRSSSHELSDHAPVAVTVTRQAARGGP